MTAIARRATAADAGRACPFCRFALKAGAQAAQCPACSAVHHAECWADNGGCAIMGCTAAPGQRAAAPAPPPLPPPPRVAPAPTAGAGVAPPPPTRSGSPGGRGLLVAVIVATLVVAGSAVALVLSRSRGSHAVANVVTTVITATAAAAPPVTGTTTVATPPRPADAGADETKSETEQTAIERVLTAYYQHVVASDFDAAWALLSPTYTTWKAGNGGHAKWLEQERVNRDRLDPSGLHVEVDRIDGDVATISVTGMHFRSPTSSRCAYEGVTWARRDGSRWRYDQGYLQNATRAARWRPRRTETLGYTCESSGY
ncbi:RING finger protein [Baekduia sp.]|uniref:RING finger protein n=1 Tax=Baekduia sp. TaxID=2600305 RepID=UPI002E0738F8|nr:RING finger protein [Baekduia sp.]